MPGIDHEAGAAEEDRHSMKRPFFYRESHGIRITVRPEFLREHSDPPQNHYVFSYAVRIENVSTATAQLLSRRWLIHDEIGQDTEVAGAGVVGEQPVLAPGGVHEYRSFCILKSGEGYMEGQYRFVREDGSSFHADIPRFLLRASEANSEWAPGD